MACDSRGSPQLGQVTKADPPRSDAPGCSRDGFASEVEAEVRSGGALSA